MRYLLLLLVLSAAFWACQPEEACISSATSRVVVDFFVPAEDELGRPVLRADTINFQLISGLGASNAFYTKDKETDRISRVILRLNPDKDTSTFYFEGIARNRTPFKDTLVVSYQRSYRLISPDCPLEVSFEQLQVVRSTLDSIKVINTKLVEPSTDTDVQIIFTR